MSLPPHQGRRTRLALLFGGRSGEHSISCIAAGGMMRAIDPERFEILPVGITRTGRWTLASADPASWDIAEDGAFPTVPPDGPEVLLPADAHDRVFRLVSDGHVESLGEVDVVFPLLHGAYGEDGTLQGALDLIDLPYVGPGVLACAIAMDKEMAKSRLAAAGLPTVPAHTIDGRKPEPAAVAAAAADLGWPVFVKPARAGSSLGVSKASNPSELDEAIRAAAEHDPRVLIERAIAGREVECGVIGGGVGHRPRASTPGEVRVVARHDFYSFDAKYRDEAAVELDCPADLPSDIVHRIQTMAVQAFEAIGAEGLSRVDFFYDPAGPGRAVPHSDILVNEVNTMPGFTPFSLYPRMFAHDNLGYGDLVAELVDLALARPTGLR